MLRSIWNMERDANTTDLREFEQRNGGQKRAAPRVRGGGGGRGGDDDEDDEEEEERRGKRPFANGGGKGGKGDGGRREGFSEDDFALLNDADGSTGGKGGTGGKGRAAPGGGGGRKRKAAAADGAEEGGEEEGGGGGGAGKRKKKGGGGEGGGGGSPGGGGGGGKGKRAPKPYVPQVGSANYAFLVCLYTSFKQVSSHAWPGLALVRTGRVSTTSIKQVVPRVCVRWDPASIACGGVRWWARHLLRVGEVGRRGSGAVPVRPGRFGPGPRVAVWGATRIIHPALH